MNRTDALYQSFLEILREELVPAMGCTEPIAIAYAAAQARAVLGKRPERVRIEVSGNIIKNVKSVIVPHTGSMHGIAAAAAAGIIAGREDRELEVLSEVTEAQIEDMRAYLKEAAFEIRPIDSPFIFDIRITVCAGDDQATARIVTKSGVQRVPVHPPDRGNRQTRQFARRSEHSGPCAVRKLSHCTGGR